jgi:pyrimidine-nucleoside phosphorylase
MEKIGTFYGKEVFCEITDMNTPLGDNIGNSLEVIEAMDVLQGKKGALRDLCIKEASKMVSMSKNISIDDALKEVNLSLENGNAYRKFQEFVKAQNGDISSLSVSPITVDIKSNKSGILKKIKALSFGQLSLRLGAGRINKEDLIDPTVGIHLNKHLNEEVQVGDILCTLYVQKKDANIEININDYFEIV